MANDIISSILEQRKRDVKQKGFGMGYAVPQETTKERTRPVVPFLPSRGVILEVKRASPSKGDIAPGLDAARTAAEYTAAGAAAISVLTEEHWFKGSLADLAAVANAVGDKAAVLRKDFLYHPDEVDVSYLCGADAVLVIARMLDADTIAAMLSRVAQRGMAALVELRTAEDVHKVKRALSSMQGVLPAIVYGVNARDLKDFSVDMLQPLAMLETINEVLGVDSTVVLSGFFTEARASHRPKVITESGVKTPHAAKIAGSMGFWGLLLGEAAVRSSAANKVAPPVGMGAVLSSLQGEAPQSLRAEIASRVAQGGRIAMTARDVSPSLRSPVAGPKDFVEAFLSGEAGRNAYFWRQVAQKRAMASKSVIGSMGAGDAQGMDMASVLARMNAKARASDRESTPSARHRPLVKICGLTRAADAVAAAAAGADILGFVFWKKSKRCATEIVVREVRRMLDSMTWDAGKKPLMVGVVADKGLAAQAAINLGREGVFDAVQFHGCCAEEIERGDYDGIGHYAAVNVGSKGDIDTVKRLLASGQMRVLIDAMVTPRASGEKMPGGTGVNVDSALCALAAKEAPLWLAGGIKPDNVARIVGEVHPELIDVSSGVESNPGIKNHAKIAALFAKASANGI